MEAKTCISCIKHLHHTEYRCILTNEYNKSTDNTSLLMPCELYIARLVAR
ncbi:MAG: hypothetical protein Q4Q22_08060 [Methanosphaera sp.]|nr:hypothetical protein [Methanosphaera sp.]